MKSPIGQEMQIIHYVFTKMHSVLTVENWGSLFFKNGCAHKVSDDRLRFPKSHQFLATVCHFPDIVKHDIPASEI